jgi:hypothetical protein
MTYEFKWKRWVLWQNKAVIGHRLDKEINRMDLYLQDGSIYSIPQWDKCTLKLGTDWVLFTKKQMEKESGQNVSLAV